MKVFPVPANRRVSIVHVEIGVSPKPGQNNISFDIPEAQF